MDIKKKELTKTKAPIANVFPNPFRNFEINPIRDDHVEKLLASIEDIGMWSGLPARKIPDTTPAEYQIACGHHRFEAIKKAGLYQVPIDIRPYTDEHMIRIMVEENMTQRGNENAGTVLDSVAAVIIQTVKKNLGDKCHPDLDGNQSARIRDGKGVGPKAIIKEQSTITERNAKEAVYILKATGNYADLIKKGGAPEEIVQLYRAGEGEAIPNALRAVTHFEKASHGRAFIDTVKSNQKIYDRSEDEYCKCVASILEENRSITSGRIEKAVLEYFELEQPKAPEPPSADDQDRKESTVTSDKPEKPQKLGDSDTTPESADKEKEGVIDTILDQSAKESVVNESNSSYQEAFQQLQLAISKHINDGWKAGTKTSALSFLKKLTVEICEDQSAVGDIPPSERLGDTIIDLLESMDKHVSPERDKTLKEIKKQCDRRLKGVALAAELEMAEAV